MSTLQTLWLKGEDPTGTGEGVYKQATSVVYFIILFVALSPDGR